MLVLRVLPIQKPWFKATNTSLSTEVLGLIIMNDMTQMLILKLPIDKIKQNKKTYKTYLCNTGII